MEVKRLFISTFVETKIFERHFHNIQKTFDPVCSGKWTEIQNLHFTYKFLGNVPVDKISEVADLIKDRLITYPGNLKFNGLGVINSPKKPRILYARVHSPDKSVQQNFHYIEKILTEYGFPKEKVKFLPHVTLLRIKQFNEQFENIFLENKDNYIGKQVAYKIALVSSTLTHDGPIYQIIE